MAITFPPINQRMNTILACTVIQNHQWFQEKVYKVAEQLQYELLMRGKANENETRIRNREGKLVGEYIHG